MRLRWRIAIPIALVLALVVAPFVFRAERIAGLPDIGDPFDVAAFVGIEIPDADNALILYRAAASRLVDLPPDHWEGRDAALEGTWEEATPEIRQWLADNEAALYEWRHGTAKPDALFYNLAAIDWTLELPALDSLRTFGRLAVLESRRLEAEGDLEGAWEWQQALLRSSRHCGRRGGVIERRVGIALHAIGAQAIEQWSRHPELEPVLLRRALDALIADYEATAAPSESLKVEYLAYQNNLRRAVAFRRTEIPGLEPISVSAPVRFLFHEPELSRRVGQQLFANWLAQIDLPLHARRLEAHPLAEYFGSRPVGAGAPRELHFDRLQPYLRRARLAHQFLPTIRGFDNAVLREEARQATLVVTLAARLFERQRGAYPAQLEDLLEGFLAELPGDPFSHSGGPLRYRADGARVAVWSVGENGRDDGGVFDQAGTDIGFEIRAGSW